MSGTNSIEEWDSSKSNIMTDTNYSDSSIRESGAVSGIADPMLYNKLFRQTSVVCSAIGEWLAALGYTVNDNSVSNIATMLNQVITSQGGTISGDLTTNKTTVNGAATFGSTATLNADPTTALQAATKQYVDNKVVIAAPPGVIEQYSGASAPTGWLLCNGSAVSRTTYADLYNAIGTIYGGGDGSTTFNLPNPKDRFILGKGDSYTTLGATGGSTTHTLSTSELPDLASFLNNTVAVRGSNQINDSGNAVSIIHSNWEYTEKNEGNNYGWFRNSFTSLGGAANNAFNMMPPYIVLNYIIKY